MRPRFDERHDSQPNMNSVVAALQHTERTPSSILDALKHIRDYWETVRTWYRHSIMAAGPGTAEVYIHEMPVGTVHRTCGNKPNRWAWGARWLKFARTYAGSELRVRRHL